MRSVLHNKAMIIIQLVILVGLLVGLSLAFQEPTYAATEWGSFRGNAENNAVVDYPTPTYEDNVTSLWTNQFADSVQGMSKWESAPNPSIIVNGDLIVLSGKTLQVLDAKTGIAKKQMDIDARTNFGLIPVTYAEVNGRPMAFLPLAQKTEAVYLDTMEKAWTYTEPKRDADGVTQEEGTTGTLLYAQSVSPIVYSDGVIYTGFYTSYSGVSSYVAIAVEEKSVTKTVEEEEVTTTYNPGEVMWRYMSRGGFYWNGAVVIGDHVIVGTQDGVDNNDVTGVSGGEPADSHVISFDKKTGDIVSDLTLEKAGDICSTVVYDKEGGRIYWTACSGRLYSAAIDSTSGTLTDLKHSAVFGSDALTVNTPVVYKDRVYIGYKAGSAYGCFGAFDKNTLDKIFETNKLRGYPKSSPFITTAYEDSTGYLYAYIGYYQEPGGVQMIRFKADTTSAADVAVKDVITCNGYSQYASASPIADEDGVIYYNNDSTTLFAVKKSGVKIGKVTGLKVTTNGKKVTAKWNKLLDTNQYRLLYRLNDAGSWKSKVVRTNKLTFSVTNGSKVNVRVKGYHVDPAGSIEGAYSGTVIRYAASSTIKKLARAKKAFTVKYDKHKGATGYQIKYSLKKTMKAAKSKKVKGASKVTKKITGLKTKKKYYVRVRSYRKIGSKTYYGKWSSVKSVRTK